LEDKDEASFNTGLNTFLCTQKFMQQGMVTHACNSSYYGGGDKKVMGPGKPGQSEHERLPKKKKTKRKTTRGMAQVMVCLLSMCQDLG
jgi:hypothetical protein